MRTTIYIFIIFWSSINITIAQGNRSITLTNNSWVPTVSLTPVSVAGNDYTSTTLTSDFSETLLNINSSGTYTISVSKSDTDWDSGLSLWMRRTGDGTPGTGNATISANIPFVQLTNIGQTLFTGDKNRNNVPIQFEIRGLSVLLPAKSYQTTIVFTISN